MKRKPIPLIAPKHVTEFSPGEYHTYVSAMYELPAKPKSAKPRIVDGLSVTVAKDGAIKVRRGKARTFDYVTFSELEAFARALGLFQSDIWNAFKARGFVIARTRIEAERTHAAAPKSPKSGKQRKKRTRRGTPQN